MSAQLGPADAPLAVRMAADGVRPPSAWWTATAVLRKELVDALRETRTLMVVLAAAVFVGPLAALFMLTGVEDDAAPAGDVQVSGIDSAPGLKHYLERHRVKVLSPPADFESQLRSGTLSDPVVVVPTGFEAALAEGQAPVIEVVIGTPGQRSDSEAARVRQLLQGFVHERVASDLSARGIDAKVLEPVRLENRNLVPAPTTASTFARILPFMIIVAVLYGALNAALDTTAGERERGSLEPLLANPSRPWALALGKWGAVAAVTLLVAALCCLSLLLTQWALQWLMHSDRLQTMLHFGVREALLSLVLMLPFAAVLPAALMAIAIRCRTYKEAQAKSNLLVLLLSILPVAAIFSSGEATWQLWLPGLAQNILLGRVFNGDALSTAQLAAPFAGGIAMTAAGIVFVAVSLREAAAR